MEASLLIGVGFMIHVIRFVTIDESNNYIYFSLLAFGWLFVIAGLFILF